MSPEYERLRGGAVNPTVSGNHFGLVVLLREGIAAWIESSSAWPDVQMPTSAEPHSLAKKPAQWIGDEVRADIIAVVANMVMAVPKEQCA